MKFKLLYLLVLIAIITYSCAGGKQNASHAINHTITFTDNTNSSSAPYTKTHLTGAYAYLYDGSTLQMAALARIHWHYNMI